MLEPARYFGVRYDAAKSRGHVESYFLKANDPSKRRALWLKATIYAGDRPQSRAVAEAWAIAFDAEKGHVAVKSVVPYERARFSRDAIDVELDGCVLTPNSTHGGIATAERRIEWDLGLTATGAPLVHFPRAWMYEAPFPSSKLVSPLP